MKHLKLIFACLLTAIFSIGQVWAAEETKTEGFETKAAGTNYQSTVTVSTTESDCGIEWTIYYGTVSTNDKISGSQSAQMRYYSSSNNRGYVQSATPIEGLSNVAFKARVSSTNIKMTVSYSANASDWTALATNETFSETGKGIAFNYDVPSGGKYIKIEIGDGSTKPASGNIKFIVDDVVFTYETGSSTPTCATPTFSPAAGSYEGTQNVTISSTTTGATIYYTTDDSDPTTSGTRQTYSSPIAVSADMTIKAYAVKEGSNDSEVATAAYTITEGPDVIIDFTSNTEWQFPTSNTLDEGTFSDGTYTVKVKGEGSGKGYKFSSGKLLIGQNGAYLLLPEFANPIAKIVCPGVSGASSAVKWNVYDGETAVSTEVTGCTSDVTFNIDPLEANKQYKIRLNSAHNLQISHVKIYFGEAPAVAKPTIFGDANFVTSTTVTISHDDADAIYYTTDGSKPTTSSTAYSAPFSLTESATVKAIAVKGSDESAVASKDFNKVSALSTMAEVQAAATSAETEDVINVAISNWVVTAVSGNQVWFTASDNLKGILLYKKDHGFAAGNKLNGVVVGTKIKLYNNYPQLTSLLASEVTVTSAEAISPRTTTIAALTSGHPAEQGTIIKLENLTYTASSTSFSDGENSIQIDTKLGATPTLVDAATYNVTGVVEYLASNVIKIMPRSNSDVEQVSGGGLSEVTDLAALKAEATGVSYLLNLTDAIVTFTDNNNAFIEDATAGALIYYKNGGHGFSAGDKLNGQYEVTTATFNGKFEITAITATTGTKTTGAEIPVTTLTIAQLNANFAANESKRIKIVGVNVTDAVASGDVAARTGEISDGVNTIILYAGKSGVTATLNDNIDVIGYPTPYVKDETNQQQFAVWAQADITVNEKEDAGLAYDPATESIAQGDAWSAPTLNNPHSLTIASYASNNESVATVTDGGVIALAGGIGTAIITAHFAGDATYAAADATYTITVNEAGSYTMTFDLTRASYDDASKTEVVWNSNVATIVAAKASASTNANNYIGGAYDSSNKFRTETRFYKNSTLTFTPQTGVEISKVEYTASSNSYATELQSSEWTNATATVDAKVVTITPTDKTAAFSATIGATTGATSIKVYYAAESAKARLTGSISIADINIAVGDADIVLLDIAATSNPNKNAISYSITSGSEYVELVGTAHEQAFHAIAEGTATITATIPDDFENYTGATTTFDIVVAAAPATLVSVAVSGTPDKTSYYAGQNFDPAGLTVTGTYSDASTAPITEGITWSYNPSQTLAKDQISIGVTATVNEIPSAEFEVTGLTVTEAPAPTTDDIVILAKCQGQWYAVKNVAGSANHTVAALAVNYHDGKVFVAAADRASITWSRTIATNTVSFLSNSKYLAGKTSDSNDLDLTDDECLWSYNAVAGTFQTHSAHSLLYSSSAGVFKNYKSSNKSEDGETGTYSALPIMVDAVFADPEPDYETVRSGLEIGRFYTVCLPKKIVAVDGATFWNMSKRNADASLAYLEEATAPFAAGTPFIFQATATTLKVAYEGDAVSEPEVNGALRGRLEEGLDQEGINGVATATGSDIYMLKNNELRKANGQEGNTMGAYKAYVVYNDLQVAEPVPAPGRRVLSMPMQGESAQGVENIETSEKPMKLMIDGQLFIIRGEKMYDVTGKLVK